MNDECEKRPLENLGALRWELDRIDQVLLEQIALRLSTSKRIGIIKSREGIPVMQPQRVLEVLENRTRTGKIFGIREEFVKNIFNLLIRESVRIQEDIQKNGSATKRPLS